MSVSTPDDFIPCKICSHPKSLHVTVELGNAPPICKSVGCDCHGFA